MSFAAIIVAICVILAAIYKFITGRSEIIGGYCPTDNVAKVLSYRLTTSRDKYCELFNKVTSAGKLPPVLTFDDIKHTLPYEKNARLLKPTAHIGHRKLFLCELQFLTEHPSKIILYVGAAPGNHITFLSTLCGPAKFVLFDSSAFEIEGEPVDDIPDDLDEPIGDKSKIYIINSLFTMDHARKMANFAGKFNMISDIRTKSDDTPSSYDILWNMAQQYNWIHEMRPAMSMLKFRFPFYDEKDLQPKHYMIGDFNLAKQHGIDFITDHDNKQLHYFDGKINLQAFPGAFSTESRLITTGVDIHDYGAASDYDDKFFYYNSIERCFGLHENTAADRALGFDYCNDCAIEYNIWKAHLGDEATNQKIQDLVQKLSSIVGDLFKDGHGYLFDYYPPEQLVKAAEYYKKHGTYDYVKYFKK